jgi:electron transport complex protein RnfG
MMKTIVKPAAILFISAAVTVALLALVYAVTLEPIAEQMRRKQKVALGEVLPQADAFKEYTTTLTGSMTAVYEGVKNDRCVGYVVELAPMGYGGEIALMVGICESTGTVSGMRIVSHSETPGFGSLATREDYYNRYEGRPLTPIVLITRGTARENEMDAITGSTITSRAITNAVNEAIAWYNANKGAR